MNKYDNEAGSLAIDSLLNYETVKVSNSVVDLFDNASWAATPGSFPILY